MDPLESSGTPADSGVEDLLALCRSGRLADAEAQARRLIRDCPDQYAVTEILAGILLSQRRFEEAIPVYEQAIEARPKNADAYFAFGNLLLYMGRAEAAIDQYRKAVEHQPGFVAALSNLGVAYLGVNRYAEAVEVLKQAIDLDPNFADAYGNLGIALKNLDRGEEAVASFQRGLELDPNAHEIQNSLGAYMEGLGRLDEAVARYVKAVEIMPNYAEAHCNLGNALAKRGDHADAIECYRVALEIRPDFAEARNGMGVALKELGRFQNAEDCFRQATAMQAGTAEFHNNLAAELRRQGKLDEATASAHAAIAQDPDCAEAYFSLGATQHLAEQFEAAIESYEKALAIRPDFEGVRERCGQVLQKLGRFEEAITHFEASDSMMSQALILECEFALGRRDEYDERLRALCESDPKNLWIAGGSVYAAHQWKRKDPYPFCKNPLDFIYVQNVRSQFPSFEAFSADVMAEIDRAETVWEPPQNTTVKGYHTLGNLFLMDTPGLAQLRLVVSAQLEAYRTHFADRDAGIITQWPEKGSLYGWHIRLLQDGYQVTHNHPAGWVSGVIYLDLPEGLEGEEGSINFTLHGPDYPVLDDDIPTVRHTPSVGDLVLFPSSLYHFTRPFHTPGERHVVAFDLCPVTDETE